MAYVTPRDVRGEALQLDISIQLSLWRQQASRVHTPAPHHTDVARVPCPSPELASNDRRDSVLCGATSPHQAHMVIMTKPCCIVIVLCAAVQWAYRSRSWMGRLGSAPCPRATSTRAVNNPTPVRPTL
jgi:hypothetical protein